MHSFAAAIIAGFLATSFCASTADALNARTWISGKGSDSTGCGPVAMPCRSLQFAHDQTSAGGEIDVLDPAGYGSIVITKSINVINDGVGVAGALAPAKGSAITVNAPGATILLRGLAIEGAGTGSFGINFTSGANLIVDQCTVQNFVGSQGQAYGGTGIYIAPSGSDHTSFSIMRTVLANNSIGIAISQAKGTTGYFRGAIDQVSTLMSNSYSIYVEAHTASNVLRISNTFVNGGNGYDSKGSGNSGITFFADSTADIDAAIDSVQITGHAVGLYIGNGLVLLNRSTISGNYTGVSNDSTSAYSLKTNLINGNAGSDINGFHPLLTTFALQ